MADFNWKVEKGVINVTVLQDGEPTGQSLEFDTNEYPDAIRDKIYDFGCKSLFQARASQVATKEKFDFWEALDERFSQGEWALERKVGAIVVAAWVEALAQHKACSVSALQSSLKDYSKEQREQIKGWAEANLKTKIDAIKAKRDSNTPSLDDLLNS